MSDILSKNEVAVVIPLYRRELTAYELISIEQCVRVLIDYPKIYVIPQSLKLSRNFIKSINCSTIRFADRWFKNIRSYSKLLLSKIFYEKFLEYKYILIYQPDAFVFSDQLLDWALKNYSYIGAPWLHGETVRPYLFKWIGSLEKLFFGSDRAKTCFVGNGGFSLRNTNDCLKMLDFSFKHKVFYWRRNEDSFWSYCGVWQPERFRIPNLELARQFAFELEPQKSYMNNNEKLPFGCHAWAKYDIDFWRPIFKSYGYNI
jgi:hypothetical protein